MVKVLTGYKRLNAVDREQIKKHRQIGRNAFRHGIDRAIADDFAVQYRRHVRDGWDEESTKDLANLFGSINMGGHNTSKIRKKHSY